MISRKKIFFNFPPDSSILEKERTINNCFVKFIILMIRYVVVFDFQCSLQFELILSVIDSDVFILKLFKYLCTLKLTIN